MKLKGARNGGNALAERIVRTCACDPVTTIETFDVCRFR